ncbi:MAG TPA: hypothetical protein VG937_10085 [Polyangiaceae bacterium]|nr:hypothetical protein [Polyangiaceae bacterium]
MKTFLAALALGLCSSSCLVETDSDPVPPASERGSLIVDWTINGSRDPDQCDQGDAEAIDVVVYYANGETMAEYQASCRAFVTRIDLPRGQYAADAVLIDASGAERTTVVDMRTFEIFGGDELDIPIDFPASSFR